MSIKFSRPVQFAVLAAVALAESLACNASAVFAQVIYDASADFDISNNPSQINGGAYSYGYETTLGSSFTLFPDYISSAPLAGYDVVGFAPDDTPALYKNTSDSTYVVGGITYQPDQLVLHPGISGQYSVLRFTAPSTGVYAFDATFNAADSHPTTTDLHILVDNTQIDSGGINVDGGGSTAEFSSTSLPLLAGETLDFEVGYGNGNKLYDSTGLFATVANIASDSTWTSEVPAETAGPGDQAYFAGTRPDPGRE